MSNTSKSACSNLWTGYYVCVGVPGTNSSPPTSTTSPSNGVSTPTPVQSGIITDCATFYQVHSGDTCTNIASQASISLADFYTWNPAVGTSCSALWTDYYVCVENLSRKSSPTTVVPGNGIATPTPAEPGMVSSCTRFHLVHSGDTCQAVAPFYGITPAQIIAWNPNAGSQCTNLWTGYYVCVAIM
jgi:LysM repeat protein